MYISVLTRPVAPNHIYVYLCGHPPPPICERRTLMRFNMVTDAVRVNTPTPAVRDCHLFLHAINSQLKCVLSLDDIAAGVNK